MDNGNKSPEVPRIPRTEITARDSNEYMRNFGYKETDFKGKRILDVGAGFGNFNKVVEQNGGELIRLDASYALLRPQTTNDAIVGTWHNMPFKDGSFDESISSYGSLFWSGGNINLSFSEMMRVTKNEGTIRINPSEPKNVDFRIPEGMGVEWSNWRTLKIKNPAGKEEKEKLIQWCIENFDFFPPLYDPDAGRWEWKNERQKSTLF